MTGSLIDAAQGKRIPKVVQFTVRNFASVESTTLHRSIVEGIGVYTSIEKG
jgi:hypothetical protein